VINLFCNDYAGGLYKAELQVDNIFFDHYKCINIATGNISNMDMIDAAAVFEETFSENGYRFGVVFRGSENLKLYPEAFAFDLYSSLES